MKRARDWRDPFNGRPADELHHITGRIEGRYPDPDFVVPLTRAEHALEHSLWRAAGIGEESDLPSAVLRLRRASHFFVRLGRRHAGREIVLPDFVVVHHGLSLARISDEIEADR